MHLNVILTNKRHTHAQSNYTNTKLAWFRRLLRHPARKQSGPILHPRTHTGVNSVHFNIQQIQYKRPNKLASHLVNENKMINSISRNNSVHRDCAITIPVNVIE